RYERNILSTPRSGHEKWWRGFKERKYRRFSYQTPESLSRARNNLSEQNIRQWFSDVSSCLKEKDMGDILEDPCRIFNFDESGFQLTQESQKVLGVVGTRHCFETATGQEKKQITTLTTVGADGSLPPPMIIYPRKRIDEQMASVPGQPSFVVGKSESGWISFETLYEYLVNHFSNWLTQQKIVRPVLVFTDWHETRANFFWLKD
ncbi:unnamed protein product, partial [Meganyctiphanes norvegica]